MVLVHFMNQKLIFFHSLCCLCIYHIPFAENTFNSFSMALASTSSASHHTHLCRHDVFLSFRGEDTRHGFVSHLDAALRRKSINTFIDKKLERGEEISHALLKAIEESKFAVIVFSKDYASSKWCLDELAKIIECNETRGQNVIPVFYHVSPSDVRKQSGIFAEAFAGHDDCFKANLERVQRWRAAFTKAANLSGWVTQNARSESEIIDEIVNHMWRKLEKMWPGGLEEGLVGISSRIEQLRALLCNGSSNVFILGLWGMGGIGKTTVAGALFDHIKCQFEGCCFLANVREASKKHDGLRNLGEELLSKILEERDIRINTYCIGDFFINMLRHRKVLLVLDDVDDKEQLEYLAGDRSWFGPGSRIVITSRDKQVLRGLADVTYEVKPLVHHDALQLLRLHAFKRSSPTDEMMGLSGLVVKYAKGVPLAVKVLGSFLFGKSKKEWESSLRKLENAPNKKIQNILRISYDGLDEEEREIFLHIACFWKGWNKDYVLEILNDCGFSMEIALSVLVDKSLVMISNQDNSLEMHDLLQEMGKEVVRQESKDPGKRSRLWHHQDIYQVLRENSGTKTIQGLFLDMSKIQEVQLQSDAFAKMCNLKFLKVYDSEYSDIKLEGLEERFNKVHLPEGISSLPDQLRYLYWDAYPLKYLPPNFRPKNLIELSLRYSNVKRLWKGDKDFGKLRKIDLSYSQHLTKIPKLSWAPNVTKVILEGCTNLHEVSSSIRHLSNITYINLATCPNLRSLPTLVDLKSLETLDLSWCSNLETFPILSGNVKYLYLSVTAIKEVPSSSVECLDNLVELCMMSCAQLESLPSNIDLKCLEILDLSSCYALEKFPEISSNLLELILDETAIAEVPSSLARFSRLVKLSMRNCTKLEILASNVCKLQSLQELRLDGCSSLKKFPHILEEEEKDEETLDSFTVIENRCQDYVDFSASLNRLFLSYCNLCLFPADLGLLSSLEEVDLKGNSFESIPASITQLSQLKWLNISHCQKLKSLPELPRSLFDIDAYGCRSLETVSSITQLLSDSEYCYHNFNFANCLKLDEEGCEEMARALMRNQHLANQRYHPTLSVNICYPGSRIPEWFKHQRMGNSIRFRLPPNWLNDRFLGFVLGIVYEQCGVYSTFRYSYHFGDHYSSGDLVLTHCQTEMEHVALQYHYVEYDKLLETGLLFTQSCQVVALFKFYEDHATSKCNCKIKMCGVIPLYLHGQDEGYDSLDMSLGGSVNVNCTKESFENKRCRREDQYCCSHQADEDEVCGNAGSVEMEEPPKRLKQTEGSTIP